MPAPKPVVSVESINAICYDLGHDIDFNKKSWLIGAFHSEVHQIANSTLDGYDPARVNRLVDQWIAVRQGKLNPVPRSYP